MKKIIIFLFVVSFIPSLVFSEPPNWYVPEGFEQSMSIVCRIFVNNEAEKDPDNLIGAFVGEEVRGVNNTPFFDIGDSVFVTLNVRLF